MVPTAVDELAPGASQLFIYRTVDRPGAAEMIRRGRGFLIQEQNPDGSWPETTRPPGAESYAQRISTTGWATLALLAHPEKVTERD